MSCTLHVATIPSFPPSMFWHHSLAARISLCLLPSRPSSSTLQTTRSSIPVMSCTPHVPAILSFPPSIFWCESPDAYSLLCLSPCTSHFHVLAAPQCKQPMSGIPVMSYTPHVPIIQSSYPQSLGVTQLAPTVCCASLIAPLPFTSQQLHTTNNWDPASL